MKKLVLFLFFFTLNDAAFAKEMSEKLKNCMTCTLNDPTSECMYTNKISLEIRSFLSKIPKKALSDNPCEKDINSKRCFNKEMFYTLGWHTKSIEFFLKDRDKVKFFSDSFAEALMIAMTKNFIKSFSKYSKENLIPIEIIEIPIEASLKICDSNSISTFESIIKYFKIHYNKLSPIKDVEEYFEKLETGLLDLSAVSMALKDSPWDEKLNNKGDDIAKKLDKLLP